MFSSPAVLTALLGAFELFVWSTDARPFSTHDPAPLPDRVLHVLTYALPHLALAAFGAPLRGLGYYLPILLTFTIDLLFNSWVPYLCSIRGRGWAATEARLTRANALRLLPPLCGRPAPALEHTLLLPLALFALASCSSKLHAASPDDRGGAAFGLALSGALVLLVQVQKLVPEFQRQAGGEGEGRADGLRFDYSALCRAALVGAGLLWFARDVGLLKFIIE